MGNHAKSYTVVSYMYGREIPMLTYYDLDTAKDAAMRLQKYHETVIREVETNRLIECEEVA